MLGQGAFFQIVQLLDVLLVQLPYPPPTSTARQYLVSGANVQLLGMGKKEISWLQNHSRSAVQICTAERELLFSLVKRPHRHQVPRQPAPQILSAWFPAPNANCPRPQMGIVSSFSQFCRPRLANSNTFRDCSRSQSVSSRISLLSSSRVRVLGCISLQPSQRVHHKSCLGLVAEENWDRTQKKSAFPLPPVLAVRKQNPISGRQVFLMTLSEYKSRLLHANPHNSLPIAHMQDAGSTQQAN